MTSFKLFSGIREANSWGGQKNLGSQGFQYYPPQPRNPRSGFRGASEASGTTFMYNYFKKR